VKRANNENIDINQSPTAPSTEDDEQTNGQAHSVTNLGYMDPIEQPIDAFIGGRPNGENSLAALIGQNQNNNDNPTANHDLIGVRISGHK
jgi:hypothetical protein